MASRYDLSLFHIPFPCLHRFFGPPKNEGRDIHKIFAFESQIADVHGSNSRFNTSSSLHQRDPRSALFEKYTGDRSRNASSSPGRIGNSGGGYGYGGYVPPGESSVNRFGNGAPAGAYRSATPNSKYVLHPLLNPRRSRRSLSYGTTVERVDLGCFDKIWWLVDANLYDDATTG